MENTVKPVSKRADALAENIDSVVISLSLCVAAVYFSKTEALLRIIFCVLASVLSEFIFMKLILKRDFSSDLSSLLNGLAISLLLPPAVTFYVCIVAAVFSVAVGVFPFGGFKNTPFLPSALGVAFSAVAFKNELTAFPDGKDLSTLISEGNVPSADFFFVTDVLSGALPGAVGCSCILGLIGAAVYLLIRNRKSLVASSGYIISSAAFAFAFPRVSCGRFLSVFLELCSGCLLFTALVLINNKVSCPEKGLRAFVYGLSAGLITMLMRYFSFSLTPEITAVLLMNALWPALTGETVNRKHKPLAPKEKKEVSVQ